jgi:hypothetical protein
MKRSTMETRDYRDAGLPGHPVASDVPMSPKGEEAKLQTEFIYIQPL